MTKLENEIFNLIMNNFTISRVNYCLFELAALMSTKQLLHRQYGLDLSGIRIGRWNVQFVQRNRLKVDMHGTFSPHYSN